MSFPDRLTHRQTIPKRLLEYRPFNCMLVTCDNDLRWLLKDNNASQALVVSIGFGGVKSLGKGRLGGEQEPLHPLGKMSKPETDNTTMTSSHGADVKSSRRQFISKDYIFLHRREKTNSSMSRWKSFH